MAERTANISQQQLTTVRADFDKDAFDRLVRQKGLKMTHEIATYCSCRRSVNGNPNPQCVTCGGDGYNFIDPCPITGVIQAIGYDPKQMQYSEINLGTAMLTTRYSERLGWFDRLTLVDGETIFMEMLYPEIRRLDGTTESLVDLMVYEPLKVDKAFMFVSPTEQQVELIEGTDYTIEGRKFILSDAQLAEFQISGDKQRYVSVRYTHRPQYLVMDIQKDIRNTKNIDVGGAEILKNLPIHCIIKKAHYLLSEQGYGNQARPE